MSKLSQTLLLGTILVLCSCDKEKVSELRNVEVTQAPIERPYEMAVVKNFKGKVEVAQHDEATSIPIRKYRVVQQEQNTTKAGIPIVKTLPDELPKQNPRSSIIKDPRKSRLKAIIVNAGFPDRTSTLPPRFRDAAKYDIQYLDVSEGLHSSYVWEVDQDENGYLWIATYGGGLARYDGRSLVRYGVNQGLTSNYCWSLEVDHRGHIWTGTYGKGVSMFDGKSFHNYSTENGLPGDHILDIEEDIEGNIWISCDFNGVARYDGNSFDFFTTESGLSSNEVWEVFQDDKRNMWFGTNGGGVSIYDGTNWKYLTTREGLSSDTIWDIAQTSDGYIWIATDGGGLNRYDGKTITTYTEKQGLPSDMIRSMCEDHSGTLWMATEGGSVCSFDGESFTLLDMDDGITSDFIRSAFCDDNGNVWFGTDGSGLNRLHPNSFRHYTTEDGMLSNYIWDIYQDSKGNIWMGTDGDGASMYNGTEFWNFTTEDGLTNDIVMSITEDRKGSIWMATDQGGVSVFDGTAITTYTTEHGLASNRLWKVYEDRKGDLWFGTNDAGVCVFDGTYYTYYDESNCLSSNTVTDIYEDLQGAMWLVYENAGVSRIQNGKIQHFSKKNGLSSNSVQSIEEDSYGNIWFGHATKGVDRFDGSTFTNFTTNDGLTSNIIWSITEDDDYRLWICTDAGISCIDTDTTEHTPFPKIYQFGKENGLKSLDFYGNAALHDRRDRLWFGGSQALTMLDLKNFTLRESTPEVYLTNVVIDEENVDFAKLSTSDSLGYSYTDKERVENVPKGLRLDYYRNHLTFQFAGIDWDSPQKVRFSYYLKGVDPHWSAPKYENKADYRNLPIGKHTFQVKAISATGVSSEPVSFEFRIFPPWWRTWWAIVLYVILFFLVGIVSYKIRTIKYKRRQRLLEKTVRIRTDEIFAQKQEVEKQKRAVDIAYGQLEEKNTEIMDSINYAKRIQAAILPSDEYVQSCLPNSFVLYMPKDIVAGDFYWCEEVGDKILLAAADCTGHGVPGAMVSVLCHSALNRALREFDLIKPDEILNKTREILITKFEKGEGGIRDGMDISLAVIDKKERTIQWAGANNPLWIVRKGQEMVQEIKGDKQPIGKYPSSKPFTSHELKYEEGDVIYLLTDGFPDQFGGDKGKKYKSINLKQFLVQIVESEMHVQPYKLKKEFAHWKRELEQIDDVCIIGVRF